MGRGEEQCEALERRGGVGYEMGDVWLMLGSADGRSPVCTGCRPAAVHRVRRGLGRRAQWSEREQLKGPRRRYDQQRRRAHGQRRAVDDGDGDVQRRAAQSSSGGGDGSRAKRGDGAVKTGSSSSTAARQQQLAGDQKGGGQAGLTRPEAAPAWPGPFGTKQRQDADARMLTRPPGCTAAPSHVPCHTRPATSRLLSLLPVDRRRVAAHARRPLAAPTLPVPPCVNLAIRPVAQSSAESTPPELPVQLSIIIVRVVNASPTAAVPHPSHDLWYPAPTPALHLTAC